MNDALPLLKTAEVAKALGCHVNTARRLLRQERVRPIRLGRGRKGQRWDRRDILELIDRRKETSKHE